MIVKCFICDEGGDDCGDGDGGGGDGGGDFCGCGCCGCCGEDGKEKNHHNKYQFNTSDLVNVNGPLT